MAKTIVMNPPAELEHRNNDVPVASERFLSFSLFARLAKKPTVEKFPGTLVLRHYRKGEIICRQGESGWTAFYLLTTNDVLNLRREQLQSSKGQADSRALQSEIEQLERRWAQLEREPTNRALSAAATVHLASARPTHSRMGGWLERLARMALPRPNQTEDQRPLYIPIDAPTDVSYDSRQATLHEGDLFGEQSCLYGTPRSATIVAERDCYVLEMLRNILDQIQGDKVYRAEMDAVYKARILKEHLRNLPLFSDLTDEQFARLRDIVDLIRCKDGELIYDEHDRSEGLYVVRSGLVKVMKNVSSLLAEEDILDWPKLTTFLRGTASPPSPAATHLRSLLPEQVRDGADGFKPADVLAALNEIIKNPQLPDAAAMRELASPAISEFVQRLPAQRANWSELDRRRYNRLLLETACPGTFRKRQRPGGPETVLAYLSRGDVIGEMGVMTRQSRKATCVAYVHPRPEGPGPDGGKWRREAEHVELVRISDRTCWQLLEAAPALREKMEQLIAARKQSEQRIQVRIREDRAEGLLSGRAAELGLIQGQKLMLIDLDRCTRCDECVQACVNTHEDGRTRLFLDGPRFGKYLVPTTCRACLDPVCMIGCPVGSIHRGDNRQIVIEDWCIGCGLCATNCPYGSIQMHDVGIIPGSIHGWHYLPASLAKPGWERRRYTASNWLSGKSPFTLDREFQDSLSRLGTNLNGEDTLCFRYEFPLDARLLRTAGGFKLEVTSADEGATVWINGHEVAKPAEKPKRGKREYVLTQKMNLFRAGGNVLAIKLTPPPFVPGKRSVLLDIRLDEIHVPDVPPHMRESAEISEKLVTDLAVVCDQCSSQFGQRPACVTACPHDAAMRVDARFNFPIAYQ
jgi:Fe-S-cluster-containing hydrogenase component 2/CRP-like cAMP-binding protein